MEAMRFLRKAGLVVVFAAVLWSVQGCAEVGKYVRYRAEDFVEMVDVGFTFTPKPSIGLYWNSLDLLVAGYSDLDGYFVGLGGNQIGITRFYSNCYGLMVSKERVGWGDFDKDDDDTLYVRYGGLGGLASLATGGGPEYTPACVHFMPHLGYVGVVWNARWTQILDFIVGFTTVDIAGDDGSQFGSWPWQSQAQSARGIAEPVKAVGTDAMAKSAPGREVVEPQTAQTPRAKPEDVPDRDAGIPLETRHGAISSREERLTPAAPSVPPTRPSAASRASELGKATAGLSSMRTYTVQPGDTLYGIAVRFYGDGKRWEDIQAANLDSVRGPRTLRPGTVLRIP